MDLLSNASATGSQAIWPGGEGYFESAGTYSGATITLQRLGPDGSTWFAVSAATTHTAADGGAFSLPPGPIRAAVSGGTPSGLYAVANRIRQP